MNQDKTANNNDQPRDNLIQAGWNGIAKLCPQDPNPSQSTKESTSRTPPTSSGLSEGGASSNSTTKSTLTTPSTSSELSESSEFNNSIEFSNGS